MTHHKQCEYCQERFATKTRKKRFCSVGCRQIAYLKKHGLIAIKEDEKPLKLKVIYGELYNTIRSAERIENYLDFCHSLFWSHQDFTPEQVMEYKALIAEHFRGTDNADETFLELVERAILAKRFVNERPNRFIPKPEYWLDRTYAYGLTGTKSWYDRNQKEREENPTYDVGVFLLSVAILDLYKNGDFEQINLYRDMFISTNETFLFQIYTNALVHSQLLTA
jgi:hypothetical protein